MKSYRLTRDVTKKECPWLDQIVKEGTIVYEYDGNTFDMIGDRGIACTTLPNVLPFFELPLSALQAV